jgi:STE24 endopeptidase
MRFVLFLFFSLFILSLTAAADNDSVLSQPIDTTMQMSDSSETLAEAGVATESGANFVYPMSEERKEQLISYSKFKNIWRFVGFFIEIIIIVVLLYTGLSARFRKWAESISKKKFFVYLFYILFFSLFFFLINLPFDYYREFVVEHNYEFSNQTLGEWFAESLKALAITFVLGFLIISALYWLINRYKRWWLWFSIGTLPFLVLIIIIFPVVISPMFNEFEPIKNQHLAEEMTQLAARAEIYNPDIFEYDASKQSNKLNAYFTGMFGTRRIVLTDNIINAFTVDELKYVMGHEIGHYKMNHIWKGLLLAILIIFVALFFLDKSLHGMIKRNSKRFGFSKLGNIASLPLVWLFVTIFGFATQPINNSVSRVMEYHADEYGLKLSGVTAETAATAFDKLSVYNLSDPEPSAVIEFWFYDHPALAKRIDNVKKVYNELHSGS